MKALDGKVVAMLIGGQVLIGRLAMGNGGNDRVGPVSVDASKAKIIREAMA